MADYIYSSGGRPQGFRLGNHVYAMDGTPLGKVMAEKVYDLRGSYIGALINNMVVDRPGVSRRSMPPSGFVERAAPVTNAEARHPVCETFPDCFGLLLPEADEAEAPAEDFGAGLFKHEKSA